MYQASRKEKHIEMTLEVFRNFFKHINHVLSDDIKRKHKHFENINFNGLDTILDHFKDEIMSLEFEGRKFSPNALLKKIVHEEYLKGAEKDSNIISLAKAIQRENIHLIEKDPVTEAIVEALLLAVEHDMNLRYVNQNVSYYYKLVLEELHFSKKIGLLSDSLDLSYEIIKNRFKNTADSVRSEEQWKDRMNFSKIDAYESAISTFSKYKGFFEARETYIPFTEYKRGRNDIDFSNISNYANSIIEKNKILNTAE